MLTLVEVPGEDTDALLSAIISIQYPRMYAFLGGKSERKRRSREGDSRGELFRVERERSRVNPGTVRVTLPHPARSPRIIRAAEGRCLIESGSGRITEYEKGKIDACLARAMASHSIAIAQSKYQLLPRACNCKLDSINLRNQKLITIYPTLSKMARDILSSTASSVPIERLFSIETLTMSNNRTRLQNVQLCEQKAEKSTGLNIYRAHVSAGQPESSDTWTSEGGLKVWKRSIIYESSGPMGKYFRQKLFFHHIDAPTSYPRLAECLPCTREGLVRAFVFEYCCLGSPFIRLPDSSLRGYRSGLDEISLTTGYCRAQRGLVQELLSERRKETWEEKGGECARIRP
ncbi:hypothetical protein EAG_04911 [Camponotus floridanus]|uniref:HAT C-terminal dimerisation domain-containing protein n=1 Tax=Camponotus floridanus TaxID=104421 RepID=E2ARA1_CAMFO|nr:hypothetical protein EAG_04911 [Camponotus floridanus]